MVDAIAEIRSNYQPLTPLLNIQSIEGVNQYL